jgi:hypothetical protein
MKIPHNRKLIRFEGNLEGLNDKEIREIYKDMLNGPYTVMICRGCGMYYHNPEGSLENCEITDECKECFDL